MLPQGALKKRRPEMRKKKGGLSDRAQASEGQIVWWFWWSGGCSSTGWFEGRIGNYNSARSCGHGPIIFLCEAFFFVPQGCRNGMFFLRAVQFFVALFECYFNDIACLSLQKYKEIAVTNLNKCMLLKWEYISRVINRHCCLTQTLLEMVKKKWCKNDKH